MFEMLVRSRRYAGRLFERRSWDFGIPQKVPNPYGAGYTSGDNTQPTIRLMCTRLVQLVARNSSVITLLTPR